MLGNSKDQAGLTRCRHTCDRHSTRRLGRCDPRTVAQRTGNGRLLAHRRGAWWWLLTVARGSRRSRAAGRRGREAASRRHWTGGDSHTASTLWRLGGGVLEVVDRLQVRTVEERQAGRWIARRRRERGERSRDFAFWKVMSAMFSAFNAATW